MASTENYGILGDAIPVAAEFSHSFADVFDLAKDPTFADRLEQACQLQFVYSIDSSKVRPGPVGCTSVSCPRPFSLQMRLLLPG
jgi:hypothetical protein